MKTDGNNEHTGFYLMFVEDNAGKATLVTSAATAANEDSFVKFMLDCYKRVNPGDTIPGGAFYEHLYADKAETPADIRMGMTYDECAEHLNDPSNGVDLAPAFCCMDMGKKPSLTDRDEQIVLNSEEFREWEKANADGTRDKFIGKYCDTVNAEKHDRKKQVRYTPKINPKKGIRR